MKKSIYLFLALIVIAGCRSVKVKNDAASKSNSQTGGVNAQDEYHRLMERLNQANAKFLERYGRYQCTSDDVPQMEEFKGTGHRFKSVQLGDHLILKLRLGKATYADGHPYGPTRTASRYQLLWDGKPGGEAESLFSTANEGSTQSRIFYSPKDHTVVVFDDLCWSTKRFFVFEQSLEPGKVPKWTTRYFEVPDQPSTEPFQDMARILGVGNRRIYMEINGQPYAFPFDDFLVTKLEFTVG